MNIAIVHRYYPMPGGVTSVVNALTHELKKNNSVTIITNDSSCKEEGAVYVPGGDFSFYTNTYQFIKKNNFEIIHTHSFPLAYFSPLLEQPVILTIHGYEKIYDWPSGLLNKMRICLVTVGKGISYMMSNKLISVSTLVKEQILKRWRINKSKIEVIYNPLDSEIFIPTKNKIKSKEFKIFIYSTSKRKGFDKLVSWIKDLVPEIPKIKIIVVGEKIDLPKDVKDFFEFTGKVESKNMPQIFNSVDLVIMPSIDEPFGLTAAEGMSCGKPTIVSDKSGIKDIITNNQNGIISNLEEFPQSIIKIYKNKKLRKRIMQNSRSTIRRELNPETIANKHIKLYKLALNDK